MRASLPRGRRRALTLTLVSATAYVAGSRADARPRVNLLVQSVF